MKKLYFFNNKSEIFIIEKQEFINLDIFPYSIFSHLPLEEQNKFYSYKNIESKSTFLTARYFLRKLLSEKLNIQDLSSIKISISETGKPFLEDYNDLYFNISHTKNLILIGFSCFPIGVDVESFSRVVEKESILKHFFSINEQKSYYSTPEEDRDKAFFVGWTRKEALLKATGEGLGKIHSNEVSFEINSNTPIIFNQNNYNLEITSFEPAEGYIACIAQKLD